MRKKRMRLMLHPGTCASSSFLSWKDRLRATVARVAGLDRTD